VSRLVTGTVRLSPFLESRMRSVPLRASTSARVR
jgi:hypothetical protein